MIDLRNVKAPIYKVIAQELSNEYSPETVIDALKEIIKELEEA